MSAVFRAFSWVPAGSQKMNPMEPTDTAYITWFISVNIVLGLNTCETFKTFSVNYYLCPIAVARDVLTR